MCACAIGRSPRYGTITSPRYSRRAESPGLSVAGIVKLDRDHQHRLTSEVPPGQAPGRNGKIAQLVPLLCLHAIRAIHACSGLGSGILLYRSASAGVRLQHTREATATQRQIVWIILIRLIQIPAPRRDGSRKLRATSTSVSRGLDLTADDLSTPLEVNATQGHADPQTKGEGCEICG